MDRQTKEGEGGVNWILCLSLLRLSVPLAPPRRSSSSFQPRKAESTDLKTSRNLFTWPLEETYVEENLRYLIHHNIYHH